MDEVDAHLPSMNFAGEVDSCSESLQRSGRLLGYGVYFKTFSNIRSLIRNYKNKIPFEERPGIVYKIECDWNAFYIAEVPNILLD
ncbi:hypothetical protein M513_00710 [Trichuris suis]|uniref:Uncharacterized protein n=1 Tax=Trichuris suis TaxID=68888 RepID=A0A085MMN8_9BILA|nr:hypothetical protein M513_00710 [Trichuris suis]